MVHYKIKELPITERPREKLLTLGPKALSDTELLSIFISSGFYKNTAIDIARELIKKFGSLSAIMTSEMNLLCETKGVGKAKYILLKAAIELAKRTWISLKNGMKYDENSLCEFLEMKFIDSKTEIFACMFLDKNRAIIAYDELSKGKENMVAIDYKLIARRALLHNAFYIVMAHNHPSGNIKPSKADICMTKKLKQLLSELDIEVIDHIIFCNQCVISFYKEGLLK